MKIKTKLLYFFAVLFVLSLTATTISYLNLRTLPASVSELENSHNLLDFISRLQLTINKSLMPPNDFITHGDVKEKENFDVLNNQVNTMFARANDAGLKQNEYQVLDQVKELYARVEEIALSILGMEYPMRNMRTVAGLMEEMDSLAEQAIQRLDKLNANYYENEINNMHALNRMFFYTKGLTVVSLLFTTGFGFCICIVCVRTFTKPLDKIFSGVRYFTNGRLDHHIEIESPYEFRQLAVELNQMSHNIQHAQSRLEENKQVWEDTFDTITDAVSIQDADFNLINVNKAYTKVVNMSREELLGRKCYEIIHGTNKPIENCPAAKAFDANTPQVVEIEEEQYCACFHVSAYPMSNGNGKCTGVVHIIRDVTEEKKIANELEDYRVNLEHKVEERTSEVKELLLGAVSSMSIAIDKKSPWTAGHSKRVSRYATSIATMLDKGDDFVEEVRITSLLHDIGKIGVPDVLLNSTERLGEKDLATIRDHTVFGADIIKNVKHFSYALSGILHHHEFYDGGGSPSGLKGEDIPLIARIISVADSYDAMTSERPYRSKLTHEEAAEELQKCAGTQFDPEIVEIFSKSLDILLKT